MGGQIYLLIKLLKWQSMWFTIFICSADMDIVVLEFSPDGRSSVWEARSTTVLATEFITPSDFV